MCGAAKPFSQATQPLLADGGHDDQDGHDDDGRFAGFARRRSGRGRGGGDREWGDRRERGDRREQGDRHGGERERGRGRGRGRRGRSSNRRLQAGAAVTVGALLGNQNESGEQPELVAQTGDRQRGGRRVLDAMNMGRVPRWMMPEDDVSGRRYQDGGDEDYGSAELSDGSDHEYEYHGGGDDDDDGGPEISAGSYKCSVLCVGEKPSIALSISQALSRGEFRTKRRGATPVHEFLYTFHGQPARFRVTSVMGHVYRTDFGPGYESWTSTDPATLFRAEIRKLPSEQKGSRICRHLQRCASGMDYLVLFLDCDREGENICFEVLENTARWLNRRGNEQIIFRAKFSAVTRQDLDRALRRLTVPSRNESLSVDARQELDLRMGVAFTRFQSLFFQGKYANLNSRIISFGPCQTPTLSLCVERHDLIERFVGETFWVVRPQIVVNRETVALEWHRGRVFHKGVATMFHRRITAAPPKAKIVQVDTRERRRGRPRPLNTVEMLKVASRQLHMGPGEAMHVAESLYIQGYISYPRTETSQYPSSFDIKGTVRSQCRNPLWGAYASELLATGLQRPKGGHDAGDHPPITPMRSATSDDLNYTQWRLYDYVTRHFLATVSGDCVYEVTTAEFDIAGERFSTRAIKVIDPGFTGVMEWLAVDKSQKQRRQEQEEQRQHDDTLGESLQALGLWSPDAARDGEDDEEAVPQASTMLANALVLGEEHDLTAVELVERETAPPPYLSESELIGLMEKHGIGTDASISTHIDAIKNRNYVKLGPGRTLVPQPLGIVLIHGYQRIDPELCLPSMRSAMEKQLDLIARGRAEFTAVVAHFASVYERKFTYFKEKVAKMDGLFEQHFSTLEAATGRPLSRCGKCRKWMKYIAPRPSRLYCPTCDETYALPQGGMVKLFMEKTCPLDEFELVLFTTGGANGISYPLCPLCYNHPPFDEFHDGEVMGCNSCRHPNCANSMLVNGVAECPEDECIGTLVFDPSQSGPYWKLCCNMCNFILHFAERAHSARPLKRRCDDEECNALLMHVNFHKKHTPLEDGSTHYEGCLFCDPLLVSTTSSTYGRMKKKRGFGKKKRRGRGRGRRGGSRGGQEGGKPTLEQLLNHHG